MVGGGTPCGPGICLGIPPADGGASQNGTVALREAVELVRLGEGSGADHADGESLPLKVLPGSHGGGYA